MGLAVGVGNLAFLLQHDEEGATWMRESIEAINKALKAEGLAEHSEPEVLDVEILPHVGSFPYSFLHYLRRAFSFTRSGRPPLTPAGENFDTSTDPFLDEELSLFMDSHLCCHSDAEGYYVPIDFADVIYADEVPGTMVGSTQVLERELLAIAPLLDIPIASGSISRETAEALVNTPDSDPFFRERIVWGALFANARVSIETGSLLTFS